MFKKNKPKYKIIFNNYQFYENAALTESIEKQWAEGYQLCGIIGKSCNILKFCHVNTELAKPFAVYRKNLDKKSDEEIEDMKTGKGVIIYQNNQYIVFGSISGEAAETKSEIMKNEQNILLGIPKKKCIALISILLILSAISLILKLILIEHGNFYFNLASLALYFALIIDFLFYFIGDIHDMTAGKGTIVDGILFFSARTKFKDVLFGIGDILRGGILLGSICISAAALLIVKDGVIAVNILKMWLIYGSIGYIYRLRTRHSYLSLLLIEVFLATLSF